MMRCLLCNAEMTLMNAVRDDTLVVAGFEHHTFMCSSCHDIERRLVFVRAEEAILTTQSIPSEQGGNGPAASSPNTTQTIKPPLFDEHAGTHQDAPNIGVQDQPAFQVQRVIAHQDVPIIGVQDEPAAPVQEEHAVAVRNAPPVKSENDRAAVVQNERGTWPGMYRRALTMLRRR